MSDRELLDDDGENLALRTFLAFYGNNPTVSIGAMKDCMETSGWDNHPEFVIRMSDWSMTKGTAQMWIRHLLSLEQAITQPEQEPVWCGCGDGIVADDGAKCGVCVMQLQNQIERLKAQPEQDPVGCECHRCIKEKDLREWFGLWPLSATKMILCPECGNKRCPKASDHRLACTGSNDVGQEGSIYTAPAKREWVDLTEKEIEAIRRKTFIAFQEAIASVGSGKAWPTDYAKNLIDAFKEKNA